MKHRRSVSQVSHPRYGEQTGEKMELPDALKLTYTPMSESKEKYTKMIDEDNSYIGVFSRHNTVNYPNLFTGHLATVLFPLFSEQMEQDSNDFGKRLLYNNDIKNIKIYTVF